MSLHARVALFAAVLAAVLAASTAGFISKEAVGASAASGGGVGRSLLQAKKDCPVNFEGANYTVITSQCKGPLYPPALCCQALKDFACPFTTYINDAQTTCAAAMFSYINLYGKYPPGLFANTCKEGANGLECPEDTPQIKPGEEKSASSSSAAAAAVVAAAVAPMVAVAAAVSAFLMLVMS